MHELKSYPVWSASVRWFHWINALCVASLAVVGLMILNSGSLGASTAGKINLKTLHALIGYVFAANVLLRLVVAFLGGRYSGWRAILPGSRGYLRSVRDYVSALASRRPLHYLGHNPLGRLSVTLLLLLLTAQAVSGLVLAGTDIFYPPFGSRIAQWVAAPGVDPATILPYAPEMYDKAAYAEMRSFRGPFITTHVFVFYTILVVGFLHLAAVVLTEVFEGGTLVSGMITGKKIIPGPPADEAPGSVAKRDAPARSPRKRRK